jgi:hypothetical protein
MGLGKIQPNASAAQAGLTAATADTWLPLPSVGSQLFQGRTHLHDVRVVEAEQDVDLADGGQRESVLVLVHLDLLQRADGSLLLVARPAGNVRIL